MAYGYMTIAGGWDKDGNYVQMCGKGHWDPCVLAKRLLTRNKAPAIRGVMVRLHCMDYSGMGRGGVDKEWNIAYLNGVVYAERRKQT